MKSNKLVERQPTRDVGGFVEKYKDKKQVAMFAHTMPPKKRKKSLCDNKDRKVSPDIGPKRKKNIINFRSKINSHKL